MTIFDTSVWVAYLNSNDTQHEKAEQAVTAAKLPLIVPEYIVLETCTVFARIDHRLAGLFVERISNTEDIEVILSSEQLFHAAVTTFSKRQPKSLSFVDAALLVLAKDYTVVTFDRALKNALTSL